MTSLILGSASPRRREIFGHFSIPHTVDTPDFDEGSVGFDGDPKAYVSAISEGKARVLSAKYPNDHVLTADTIVYCEGKVFGKPKDEQEALSFLKRLSGRWHSVFTAVSVASSGELYTLPEESRVLFYPTTEEQRRQYVRSVGTMDKAGSYAVQECGAIIVEKVDGCFYNVMGLPIAALRKVLAKVEIDLWDHIGSASSVV